ncbi:hypothetical protein [Pseudotamlana carrageenivorans]|uniref:Uncharacterized protein n=1 Tax=Pseudotamlana carrageenivorans TaxID=2069432 RepID=A0A2I7SLW5_9FLAO|nr:hypothetical protein [Tamlana carrageenivorans]AUS06896.1 hypothetical protein C1A40_16245 [Tamlana carrageenivorans]
MTNKTGYILGLISAIIYVIIIYGFSTNRLSDFLASLLGALLIPAIVAGLISLFSKNNFGKIFAITCVIIHVISGLGNSLA